MNQPVLKIAAEGGQLINPAAEKSRSPSAEGKRPPGVDLTDTQVAAKPPEDLPYSFAKRHGVLLESQGDDGLKLVHREGVSIAAIAEASRKAGRKFTPEIVSDDEFDARLTRHYEGETTAATDIMDDLGDCLLYTSPSPRDATLSRMPSSA